MNFSLLHAVALLWAVATAGFVILMIFRGLATMKEDDQLFLDPAESHLEREQSALRKRLEHITPYVKALGVTSAALLILAGGIWSYQAIALLYHQ